MACARASPSTAPPHMAQAAHRRLGQRQAGRVPKSTRSSEVVGGMPRALKHLLGAGCLALSLLSNPQKNKTSEAGIIRWPKRLVQSNMLVSSGALIQTQSPKPSSPTPHPFSLPKAALLGRVGSPFHSCPTVNLLQSKSLDSIWPKIITR